MYCNLVLINHTDAEFILDFAFLQPSAPQARVRARILSSPRHTKRLLRALETNIQRYEERFGKIEDDARSQPQWDGQLTAPSRATRVPWRVSSSTRVP